jgi:4-hydroxyphenylpyruvate dioxygenase
MASLFDALKIIDFDYIEFAVSDLEKASEAYLRMGFEKAGTRQNMERNLTSFLFVQKDIRIVLSHSKSPSDPVASFVTKHGEGVIDVAFRCEDAMSAFELAVNRGAEVAETPRAYKKDFGAVEQASIKTFGDVRHTFISRKGNLFADGFDDPVKGQNRGYGLERVDHITNNVEQGQLDKWSGFYEKVFGLQNTRFFDIHTSRTGLYSKVMQSPNGVIKMPFNEPTDPKSQIQEFIDINHGPGVQHIALLTSGIMETLRPLRKQGLKFLETPHTYYEMIASRVPNVTENLGELEEMGIQVDGDQKGYLLQIFTHNVIGPFFYEVIQRKGNDGFGEGNFKALFEAIERDQIRRGVLK